MNVSVLQEKLAKGLVSVSRVVSSRPTLPILSNVMLVAKEGRLQLTTTDLSLGLRLWIGAKVKKEGAITVPAKVLGELIASFPASTITLGVESDSLHISCNGNKARLAGIAASEFPSLGKVSDKRTFKVEVAQFQEAVNKVAIAASTDETRPVLSGVLLKITDKVLQFVATDGYRLSIFHLEDSEKKKSGEFMKDAKKVIGEGLIVPARALRDVQHLLDEFEADSLEIGLVEGQNLVVFSFGDVELTTRLIDGEFPNFTQVIPKDEKTILEVELEVLAKSVRTAAIFARDSANIIHWKIAKDELVVSANAPTYGESESSIEAVLKGETGEIAFNSRYLMDLFSIFPAERINFHMKGSLDPGVFRPVGKLNKKFLHLIMPVRVQK